MVLTNSKDIVHFVNTIINYYNKFYLYIYIKFIKIYFFINNNRKKKLTLQTINICYKLIVEQFTLRMKNKLQIKLNLDLKRMILYLLNMMQLKDS